MLQRTHHIDYKAATGDLVEMSIASEAPYERWWGVEILRCTPESVDLTRLADGRHPLLLNHDTNRQIGVITRAWVSDDARLRGEVRFSRGALGTEIRQDVADGIRTLVSVGYEIVELEEVEPQPDGTMKALRTLTAEAFGAELRAKFGVDHRSAGPAAARGADDAMPTYVVTRWVPFEGSLVAIPADTTVGIGRAGSAPAPAPAAPPAAPETTSTTRSHMTTAAPEVIDHAAEEKARVAAIRDVATAYAKHGVSDLALQYIGEGKTLAEFQRAVMEKLSTANSNPEQSAAFLDLSPTDGQRYSVFRAIAAMADPSGQAAKLAGFELECHRALEKRLGRSADPKRILIPLDYQIQQRAVPLEKLPAQMRDATVGTASAGGYLVGTRNTSFIEITRARSVAMRMGATSLTGLRDNVTIPKQTGSATAYWLSTEATAITESQQTYGQLSLSPKDVGAYTEVSRRLLMQSNPSAEALIMADLAAVVALGTDAAALRGSGSSGEPTGIVNTASIGSVTGTSIAYAGVLEFQTDVAAGNNLINPEAMGYVTTPSVAALLMQRQRFSSTDTPLWNGNIFDGAMAGFRAMSSTQMSSATMLAGDWSQLVIAEWGVLELEVNPWANFQAAITGVRAIQTIDVGVRYAGSFSYASSIT